MFGALRERLKAGLQKTRQVISDGLSRLGLVGRQVDDALLDELEELLVTADLGAELAASVRMRVAQRARGTTIGSPGELTALLRDELLALLPPPRPMVQPAAPPCVTLLVGVNGSGKTTTAAKLAQRWVKAGRSVVVGAADTFRAAAVEQLVVWGERTGARVVRGAPHADPASVAFDAARAAKTTHATDLLIDTAGRLHNKKPLMDELAKIRRALANQIDGAPHESLLVLDGTTGRNAIAQAREFSQIVPVTGLVLTKLDGTAKGGVAVAIGRELGLPVRYVGVGESAEDLLDFDAAEYVAGLLAPAESTRSTVS